LASKVVRLLFAQRFITIFNCRHHTSNHLSVCRKPTSLSPINCQSVDNCCIITMTQFTCKGVKQIYRISLNMTVTFTIRISRHFSSAREFQMGNFQKYWSQNVGQYFIVLYFFHRRKILKIDGRDGRDPQNRENKFCWGEIVREINVSRAGDPVLAGDKALTRETPVQRGRVNRYEK
jgi:hypothetical protein